MTTKDLRDLLLKLDPNGAMEVLITRCSDFTVLKPNEVTIVRAVKKLSSGYSMRAHETMSEVEKAAARDFVHIEGN